MVTVSNVRARNICIPLDAVTSLSNRTVQARHYGVVQLLTSDGLHGLGFCYIGSAGAALFSEVVSNLLAPVVLGEDPLRVEGLWQEMYQECLLQGRAGIVMRALSAIDTAIWDRNARAASLPLYKYLGAVRSVSVPAYASGGYYLEHKTAAMLANEMQDYVERGFTAVKMKVGRGTLRTEEERIAAVRDKIGSEVILMLDANNAWSDLPTALRFARMFENYEPYFLEEPFSPDDIENHARLGAATSIPIATGEIEAGRWRFKHLLESGAAAILQTDACVCGGVSEFRRIAATAASFGVTLCPHWFHDLHAHLVASTANAQYVEFFPDDQVLNFRRLVDTQLEVADGALILPTTPGLGFDFDEEMLNRYAISPWSG